MTQENSAPFPWLEAANEIRAKAQLLSESPITWTSAFQDPASGELTIVAPIESARFLAQVADRDKVRILAHQTAVPKELATIVKRAAKRACRPGWKAGAGGVSMLTDEGNWCHVWLIKGPGAGSPVGSIGFLVAGTNSGYLTRVLSREQLSRKGSDRPPSANVRANHARIEGPTPALIHRPNDPDSVADRGFRKAIHMEIEEAEDQMAALLTRLQVSVEAVSTDQQMFDFLTAADVESLSSLRHGLLLGDRLGIAPVRLEALEERALAATERATANLVERGQEPRNYDRAWHPMLWSHERFTRFRNDLRTARPSQAD